MVWVQHVMTCVAGQAAGLDMTGAHPGGADLTCVVIACADDVTKAVAWVSHDSSTVNPAHRLNAGVAAKDHR